MTDLVQNILFIMEKAYSTGVECNLQPEAAREIFDAVAALRQENESLRAQCGLRQIQGYHEGKQRAEAENAALRELLKDVTAEGVEHSTAKYTVVQLSHNLRAAIDAAMLSKDKP